MILDITKQVYYLHFQCILIKYTCSEMQSSSLKVKPKIPLSILKLSASDAEHYIFLQVFTYNNILKVCYSCSELSVTIVKHPAYVVQLS